MLDVAFTIEVMIETYRQESGKMPAGILLGPREYRDLCDRVRRSSGFVRQEHVHDKHAALITEYKGFPVYVKELPGIELLLPYQEAFSAAYR